MKNNVQQQQHLTATSAAAAAPATPASPGIWVKIPQRRISKAPPRNKYNLVAITTSARICVRLHWPIN